MRRFGGLVVDLAPLRESRPFRFAFAARLVSLLGIGLLVVAVPAQTYQLTGSSGHVAGVSVVAGSSVFAGSLAGGVLADRFERRRTIQLARSTAGLAFAVLGVNAVLPEPSLAVVYAASAVDGLAGGVSSAALMAVVPGLVPPRRLPAAGALLALTTDLGTVLTPALAGALIASGGVAVTYFAATAATAATVALVAGLGPCPPRGGGGHENPLRALGTGVRFAAGQPVVRSALLVGVLTALASGPLVLLPAFVDRVLGAGPSTLGLLYAAPAAGAVAGSLTSGWTGGVRRVGVALLVAVAVMAVGPLVLGVSGGVPGGAPVVLAVAFAGLAGHGLGRALADVLRFALVQRHTPDELRGRVSGLWQVQAVTGGAVGSAAAGLLGRWFPPDTALLVHGLAGLALVLLLAAATRPLWRWRTTGSARTRGTGPGPGPGPGPAELTTTGGRSR
ncbi:enterobactin transporter EntS [Kineococcus arenarius]|uniref:enterobactin transporter EntS n=1 Tax=unclassified Kineococcus TaxID=2621656 RepID=UPI003D7D6171